ncbi:DNA transposase THAP9 [Amphibalanus amphitrite]|uniref:DNA transposase THAP9 n=1 Tax=Amphibalanus amphitrite TaxID=1232801 RepID=A0A6A4WNY3_AMPAM|nr:DNA transposase THAP9 [Amphibalanus amphitrite]
MTKSCSAIGCTKRQGGQPRHGTVLSFHKFPHEDPKLLRKWMAAVRRRGDHGRPWKPSLTAMLCSDHFSEDDFRPSHKRRVLREGTIPSWFVFPGKSGQAERRSPLKRAGASLSSPKAKRVRRVLLRNTDMSGLSGPSESQQQQAASEEVPEEVQLLTVSEEPVQFTVVEELPQPTVSEEVEQSTASKEPQQPTVQELQPTLLDHSYSSSAAERHIHSPMKKMVAKVRQLNYEKKKLRQKLKRRDRRLKCLKSTLDALKESQVMDANLLDSIRARFENPIVSELFANEVVNGGRKKRGGRRYSEEIKKLCLTLHYYSPRAYKFLAKNFSLPGVTSLQEWTRSVGCEVGVLDEVLQTLASQVASKKIDPNCCLMVDEMAIRKAKVYSQPKDKFVGHVDLGAGDVEDSRLATNAMVFMAVGLKGVWRHPVAYFLTDHLTGETQAELTKTVLRALNSAGLKARTLVADGLQANMTMFAHLGVQNMQPGQLQLPIRNNFFLHPATGEKVHILLDVVHMLKLLRNLFGEQKMLLLDGEEISWKYVQALYALQQREGIRAANKLSRLHIEYKKNKMKVKLAAQLFSSSVGNALLYMAESGHHQFVGAEATARFILMIDQAFDYLNGSSIYGKGFKAPVTANNLPLRRQFLAEFSSTLFRLQTASGEPVLKTRRSTPVLGLCLAAQSVLDVSEALLEQEGFAYVLPYKMSQDHVELLFSRIRRMGGFNNNPNAVQLQHALRRLALHNFISPSATGNSTAPADEDNGNDDEVGLLQIRRPQRQRSALGAGDPMPAVVQHVLMTPGNRSAFVDDSVGYIAGYVCRKLIEGSVVKCGECIGALLSNEEDPPSREVMRLVEIRDNGGLLVPSASTYAIIASSERHLTALRRCGEMGQENLSLRIQCSVLAQFMTERSHELFPGVQEHMFEPRAGGCHAVSLLKQVVARYLRVRLHAYGHYITLSGMASAHVRHHLHKQVLFARQ